MATTPTNQPRPTTSAIFNRDKGRTNHSLPDRPNETPILRRPKRHSSSCWSTLGQLIRFHKTAAYHHVAHRWVSAAAKASMTMQRLSPQPLPSGLALHSSGGLRSSGKRNHQTEASPASFSPFFVRFQKKIKKSDSFILAVSSAGCIISTHH